MKVTFLGTSAGKPTKERNVTALALEFDQDNKWYLFDCGEATQQQLLHSSLSLGKLDTIFITHLHGDHYYGLPGILTSKKLDKALKPLRIYGPKGIQKFLVCCMDISQQYLGYDLEIFEVKEQEKLVFGKFSLQILPLVHSVESFAYALKEHDVHNKLDEKKLRALGLEPSPLYGELQKGNNVIFEDKELEAASYILAPIKGRSIIIAGDNSEVDILGDALEGLDLLVHESTYTQGVYDGLATKYLHTTAKKLGIYAQKRAVKNLIATHISPRYAKNAKYTPAMICEEIQQYYQGQCFVANDFDVYVLGVDRVLEKL